MSIAKLQDLYQRLQTQTCKFTHSPKGFLDLVFEKQDLFSNGSARLSFCKSVADIFLYNLRHAHTEVSFPYGGQPLFTNIILLEEGAVRYCVEKFCEENNIGIPVRVFWFFRILMQERDTRSFYLQTEDADYPALLEFLLARNAYTSLVELFTGSKVQDYQIDDYAALAGENIGNYLEGGVEEGGNVLPFHTSYPLPPLLGLYLEAQGNEEGNTLFPTQKLVRMPHEEDVYLSDGENEETLYEVNLLGQCNKDKGRIFLTCGKRTHAIVDILRDSTDLEMRYPSKQVLFSYRGEEKKEAVFEVGRYYKYDSEGVADSCLLLHPLVGCIPKIVNSTFLPIASLQEIISLLEVGRPVYVRQDNVRQDNGEEKQVLLQQCVFPRYDVYLTDDCYERTETGEGKLVKYREGDGYWYEGRIKNVSNGDIYRTAEGYYVTLKFLQQLHRQVPLYLSVMTITGEKIPLTDAKRINIYLRALLENDFYHPHIMRLYDRLHRYELRETEAQNNVGLQEFLQKITTTTMYDPYFVWLIYTGLCLRSWGPRQPNWYVKARGTEVNADGQILFLACLQVLQNMSEEKNGLHYYPKIFGKWPIFSDGVAKIYPLETEEMRSNRGHITKDMVFRALDDKSDIMTFLPELYQLRVVMNFTETSVRLCEVYRKILQGMSGTVCLMQLGDILVATGSRYLQNPVEKLHSYLDMLPSIFFEGTTMEDFRVSLPHTFQREQIEMSGHEDVDDLDELVLQRSLLEEH
jgi:hypothetical protein